MSSHTDSGWTAGDVVKAGIIGMIALYIVRAYGIVAYAILPKGKDGEPNPKFVPPLAILMIGATLAIFVAIVEPPYHRVMDAPPEEVRTMMARRCILQMVDYVPPNTPVKSNALIRAYCVPLDASPLPADLQGRLLTYIDTIDPIRELTYRKLKYNDSIVLAGQVFSNDPAEFRGPVWYWADGTRVSNNKYGLF